MWIVLAKAQMDDYIPTTSKGTKTSLSASSDASSHSGVYSLSYSDLLYKASNGCLLKCSLPSLILPKLERKRIHLINLL